MPQTPNASVENNFVEGLKTEFTGLNFPENACTSASNCVFTLIGDVFRRQGLDFELNSTGAININRTGRAMSSYVWTNVGGDGQTKVYVLQIGQFIYFFQFTNATIASPMSTTLLSSIVDMNTFRVQGATLTSIECQFTDGNGFLFIFHPGCDPVYCQFVSGTVTANIIIIKIRDVFGIAEPSIQDNTRPASLSIDHNYNLLNQGWGGNTHWTAVSDTVQLVTHTGTEAYTVASGLSPAPSPGDTFTATSAYVPGYWYACSKQGTVTSYSGTTLTVNVTSTWEAGPNGPALQSAAPWTFGNTNTGYITTWFTTVGNYPANGDVWWQYKSAPTSAGAVGTFSPSTTFANVTTNSGPAPKGTFIINAFMQARNSVSGLNIPTLSTTVRPRTGCWFQGRVFYTGVDASAVANPEFPYYTWTENIYFSQIVEGNNPAFFSKCYQVNDPTSETLFDLLPTDGGVITIQGSGAIYKLFVVTNGLLVFAANGVWFITGSQGIGFSATDYTITKISGVQSISSTSYVNVLGYPIFWNEEGIYGVAPSQTGALQVNNLCLGTILSFYNNIPLQSKKFVRGDYDPISFIVKWIYRSTNESSVTDRYQFDTVLNFNVIHKSFYPYTIVGAPFFHDVKFIQTPGGSIAPLSVMKYISSYPDGQGLGNSNYTFAEENNNNFKDWQAFDGVGVNFVSTFTTGYKLHGQALRKFQPMYVYVYSRNDTPTAYTINAVWDFATSPLSNKFSVRQQTQNYLKKYQGMLYRRHKLRGRGMSLQLQFTSFDGQPFELMGWAIYEHIEMSP